MASYLFAVTQAHGHVNPTLAVAQELVQRGEQVTYYLPEEFRASIEATGATFRSYPWETVPHSEAHSETEEGQSFTASDIFTANAILQVLLEPTARILLHVFERIRVERPDYIVYDAMCLWGMIVARALHIPAILLHSTYANNEYFNRETMMTDDNRTPPTDAASNSTSSHLVASPNTIVISKQVNSQLAHLCHQYNAPSFTGQEMFQMSERLNIVFIPKAFQPSNETFDERFVFVGPSIGSRLESGTFPLDKLKGRTTLYISLGTLLNNLPEFYNMCFAAFGDKPWVVVLSTGTSLDAAALDAVPDNFLVWPQVPQLDVLQHANLFITQCGMNSVMESLYYAVSMVCVPQIPEQMVTARRIQELQLGSTLDTVTLTVETLRTAVEQALTNPIYRANVKSMQQQVHNAGGYTRAADAIMHFEQEKRRNAVGKA